MFCRVSSFLRTDFEVDVKEGREGREVGGGGDISTSEGRVVLGVDIGVDIDGGVGIDVGGGRQGKGKGAHIEDP